LKISELVLPKYIVRQDATVSVSPTERNQLFSGLETAIGNEAADTLMQLLPFQPADQLVTRADMHAQTLALTAEISELRSGLTGEMGNLRSRLKSDMLHLENRFEQRFTELQVSTQRYVTAGIAANAIAVITALLV